MASKRRAHVNLAPHPVALGIPRCFGKLSYRSLPEAEAAVRHIHRKRKQYDDEVYSAYRCPNSGCSYWHVGHQSEDQRRRKTAPFRRPVAGSVYFDGDPASGD